MVEGVLSPGGAEDVKGAREDQVGVLVAGRAASLQVHSEPVGGQKVL